MGGFFKVPKQVFDDLFDNVLDYRLFNLILRNAVYLDEGAQIENVHVNRGQWIRSYRKLSEDLKFKEGRGYKQPSHQAVEKAVKRLIKRGLIKISVIRLTDKLTDRLTDRLTLIEVVEHQEYQGVSDVQKGEQLTEQLTDELTDKLPKIKNLKEKKNNSPARSAYDDNSPYMKMTNYFLEKIREWKPNYIFRGRKQTWADHFRLLHEKDKRSKKEIQDVIDWTTSNPFWQPNVLSAEKLRKQFDTLQAQMDNESKKVIPLEEKRKQENVDRKIALNKWLAKTGRGPDENFNIWVARGAKANELQQYIP